MNFDFTTDKSFNGNFKNLFGQGVNEPRAFGGIDIGSNSRGLGESSFNSNRPTDFSTGAVKSVRVVSCNFLEMVEQASMGFRPFVSNVTESGVLDMLPDFVRDSRAGANFRSESLNPYINDIVSLSSNSLGSIPVVNGWNIRRYSFTIMVEVLHSNGNAQNYMVEGFTDTPEISTQHERISIDPSMVLFINNIVSFSERVNQTTGSKSLVPVENYNIIAKDPFAQGASIHNLVTQRPYDVANLGVSGVMAGNATKFIHDTRTSVSTIPKTSNMSNNNPASYVAKILNDGLTSMSVSNTDSLLNTTTLRNMIDFTAEPSFATNGFLKQLGRFQKDYPTAVTSFTWSELTQLDPALSNSHCPYLNIYPLAHRAVHLPSTGLSCDDINGSGNEQVFASMIANGISDLMARCRATEVSVMASNTSGVDDANVLSMRCFDQTEVQLQAKMFEQLFVSNILVMLNHNTKFGYNVAAQASVWSETYVKVSLGYGSFTFLFPNFANSMYSPMLTNQKAGTEDISRHLLTIANKVSQEQTKFGHNLQDGGFSPSPI
jgi:hypothetical protein